MKRYDEELQEEVEILIKCQYGLCPLCGTPNRKPKKIKMIYVCADCIAIRFEDALALDKEYRKLEQNEEEKDGVQRI